MKGNHNWLQKRSDHLLQDFNLHNGRFGMGRSFRLQKNKSASNRVDMSSHIDHSERE